MNDRLSFNTVGSLDQYFKQSLASWDPQEALFIRKWIWEGLYQLATHEVMQDPHQKLTESEILKGHFAIKEVLKGVPIQYVVGEVPFANAQLMVNSHVLIPRPETEELIFKVKQRIHREHVKMVDIGTGSGCIAIALAKENPTWEVWGYDISVEALAVANANAIKNNVAVSFEQFDILNDQKTFLGFGCLVSNPPYIPQSEMEQMDSTVWEYEPHLALFTPNDDPLLFYKAIFSFSQLQVLSKGWVALETHYQFAHEVAAIWSQTNEWETFVEQDLQGKDRFVFAQRKS